MLKSDRDEAEHEGADGADREEAAHEAEIALARDRVSRTSRGTRIAVVPSAVMTICEPLGQHRQVGIEDGAEGEVEEAGEGERPQDAPITAVLGLVHGEQQAEVDEDREQTERAHVQSPLQRRP